MFLIYHFHKNFYLLETISLKHDYYYHKLLYNSSLLRHISLKIYQGRDSLFEEQMKRFTYTNYLFCRETTVFNILIKLTYFDITILYQDCAECCKVYIGAGIMSWEYKRDLISLLLVVGVVYLKETKVIEGLVVFKIILDFYGRL